MVAASRKLRIAGLSLFQEAITRSSEDVYCHVHPYPIHEGGLRLPCGIPSIEMSLWPLVADSLISCCTVGMK